MYGKQSSVPPSISPPVVADSFSRLEPLSTEKPISACIMVHIFSQYGGIPDTGGRAGDANVSGFFSSLITRRGAVHLYGRQVGLQSGVAAESARAACRGDDMGAGLRLRRRFGFPAPRSRRS